MNNEQEMARYQYLQLHIEEGIPLAQLADTNGISERTLRRWLSAYRKDGLAGLKRQSRVDRGKRRKLSSDIEVAIRQQVSKKQRPPLTVIHRRIILLAKEKGVPAPSYSLVADIAQSITPAAKALASGDESEFRNKHEFVHRQEASAPNEMWQADHTLLDIELLDAKGQVCRPWLTLIVDDYSRAIIGYYLCEGAPSAVNTALAFRQAIWRKANPEWPVCGIPETLYVDNGSDFISEHIRQACISLKIRLIHSMPRRPRGRGKIERLFRTVNDMLLAELPGYLNKGQSQSRPQLTILEFTARLEAFITQTYHHRNHGTTGETPIKRWSDGHFLPRLPESLQTLDLLLMRVAKLRRVQRDGIRFKSSRYVEPTLAAFVGEWVELLYDPRDLAEIRVYHEGKFVCRALCPERVTAAGLKEIQAARREQRRSAKQEIGQSPSIKPPKRKTTLKLYSHED